MLAFHAVTRDVSRGAVDDVPGGSAGRSSWTRLTDMAPLSEILAAAGSTRVPSLYMAPPLCRATLFVIVTVPVAVKFVSLRGETSRRRRVNACRKYLSVNIYSPLRRAWKTLEMGRTACKVPVKRTSQHDKVKLVSATTPS